MMRRSPSPRRSSSFCAPAGDQAPNLLLRKKSEARMNRLRGLTYTQELGCRIADAFDDVLGVIRQDIRTEVPLVHRVKQIDLPGLEVDEETYTRMKKLADAIDAKDEMVGPDWWNRHFYGFVVDRYELPSSRGDLQEDGFSLR